MRIKHFANAVTMEPFLHKAPRGASMPLPHFGKCCFNPTSNQKIKTKLWAAWKQGHLFVSFPATCPAQHRRSVRISEQMSACTNEQNKSSLVYNTEIHTRTVQDVGRGRDFVWFTAASLAPRICPEHGRHSTNTWTDQWIKEWVTCLAQLLTSLPSAFPFMKGEEYLTWVRVQTPGHDLKQLWGQFQMPAAGRRGPGPQKYPFGEAWALVKCTDAFSYQCQKPSYIQPGNGRHPILGRLRTRLLEARGASLKDVLELSQSLPHLWAEPCSLKHWVTRAFAGRTGLLGSQMALHLDDHTCQAHRHPEINVQSFLLTFHPSLSRISMTLARATFVI